ncbi:spore coat protein [Domibacillus sp. 8LH]|uniref:spore coat protein n=1 Tax=unclassified Domibacillus TaxID=2632383 RepID=UPI0028E71FFE|nr:spore coat protein [Domibacillus sp. DTU_2020_1001157_1_SI_ALB_TIR_016]WNS79088.1 spore coat protein [Domibacillus sp. DTU_2020_1001157_1_SI_ALB_TIR_016]
MSDSSKNPKILSDKVIDLLVSTTLQKNGVNIEKAKSKLSDEQKKMFKDLVEDLTKQVDSFMKKPPVDKKESK